MKKLSYLAPFSLIFLMALAQPTRADYLYDRSGTLSYVSGEVLGEDSEDINDDLNNDVNDDVNDDSRGSARSAEMKREEQAREQAKKTLEREIEARKKLNEKNRVESQLEIKTENGKFKLKQETKDQQGRVTKNEVELKQGESLHIENERGERTEIKPMVMELKEEAQEMRQERREERVENREQKLELIKDKVKARTDFNLTVNEDNELIVTKPDGSSRVVTVLPDVAVAKLEEKGIILSDETPELTENEAGEAVYRVSQEEEKRFLGIALKFKRHAEVSAETGDVTTTSAETNPVKRLLERLFY